MSIYSANRSGSIALSQLSANESYTSNDFGRIMYESVINDMKIFEAVIAADFKELRGIKEGTILESEVAALNEASLKELGNKLLARLDAFWQKIKGAISSAINKIAEYTVRSGKEYATKTRESYNQIKSKLGSEPVVDDSVTFVSLSNVGDRTRNGVNVDVVKDIMGNNKADKALDKTSVLSDALKAQAKAWAVNLTGSIVSPKEFRNAVLKEAFDKPRTSGVKLRNKFFIALTEMEKASESIKSLREAQKTAQKAVSEAKKAVKDSTENGEHTASDIATLVAVAEAVITTSTSVAISVVKTNFKNNRELCSYYMSKIKGVKHESAILEAAVEADADVGLTLGDESDDVIDSETQKQIDQVVADAECSTSELEECNK